MTCCSDVKEKKGRVVCPACGGNCFSVSRQTMLHQVQFPDNQGIDEGGYAFCPNHVCDTGYFSEYHIISKTSLRAFQPNQDAMLCHCFDISEFAYRTALQTGASESIKGFVVQKTKEKLCACESRNPSGRCCLASFKQMEKIHDC